MRISDWSSDVCSSDLTAIAKVTNPTSAESYDASQYELIAEAEGATDEWSAPLRHVSSIALAMQHDPDAVPDEWRSSSEEPRVGTESVRTWRSWWSTAH